MAKVTRRTFLSTTVGAAGGVAAMGLIAGPSTLVEAAQSVAGASDGPRRKHAHDRLRSRRGHRRDRGHGRPQRGRDQEPGAHPSAAARRALTSRPQQHQHPHEGYTCLRIVKRRASSKDPVADSTDLYAFTSPDHPNSVTLIANYIPLEGPDGGPNFYNFGDDVLYEIHISNGGGVGENITYQFKFTTEYTDPNTFLYNTGPITSLNSSSWNVRQFYSVTRIKNGTVDGARAQARVPAGQRRRSLDTELPGARGCGGASAGRRLGVRWPAA